MNDKLTEMECAPVLVHPPDPESIRGKYIFFFGEIGCDWISHYTLEYIDYPNSYSITQNELCTITNCPRWKHLWEKPAEDIRDYIFRLK